MPWQRMVADVGGEIDPDTGLPAYREVAFTVPRQNGKTRLVLAWEIQRALGWATRQSVIYSAQDGTASRRKLLQDQYPIIEPLMARLGIARLVKGAAVEGIEFRNGSRIGLMSSSESSGHGFTVDLAIKDEFWNDHDDRRDQALIPAMITRADAQVITASTAGTDASVPLNRLVTRGRTAIADGRREGIAYFEWSAAEDDDPDDPDVWARIMPAYGVSIHAPAVRSARESMSRDEFRRAFLNVWTRSEDAVIPGLTWDLVNDPEVSPAGTISLALDVNMERSAASIAACGGSVVELIEHRPGVRWAAERVAEMALKWRAPVAIDVTGPAGGFVTELEGAGVEVKAISGRELASACGTFYDAVVERTLKIRRNPSLDAAVAGATRRTTGDAWSWARRSATADICPLVAATLAAWIDRGSSSIYERRGMAST